MFSLLPPAAATRRGAVAASVSADALVALPPGVHVDGWEGVQGCVQGCVGHVIIG